MKNLRPWAAMIVLLPGQCALAQQTQSPQSRAGSQAQVAGQHAGGEAKPAAPVIPFEFRGIHLGMTIDEGRKAIEIHFPPGKDIDPRVPGLVACGDYTKVNCRDLASGAQSCGVYSHCSADSGDKTQSLDLRFVDGKLAEMSFRFPRHAMPAEWTRNSIGVSFDNYAGIHLALLDKYGDNLPKQIDVQTKSGAHYASEDSLWDHGAYTIELEELCGNIEQSCLSMSDKQLAEEFYRRYRAAQKPEI
jgi:hypothetical protein